MVQDTPRIDDKEQGLPVPERIEIGRLAKDWQMLEDWMVLSKQ